MRRLSIFLPIIFLLGAAPAFSQLPRFGGSNFEPTAWVGIGPSVPVNPLATKLNNAGWNIAGGVGLSQGYAGIMVDAFFTNFGVNNTTLRREGARSGYQ